MADHYRINVKAVPKLRKRTSIEDVELLLDVKELKAVSLPFHFFDFAGLFTGKTHFAIEFILKKTIRFDWIEFDADGIKKIIS